MIKRYRVLDCMAQVGPAGEYFCEASTPEEAARLTLGVELTRGGRLEHLRAKAYYPTPGGTATMVRLYTKSKDRA